MARGRNSIVFQDVECGNSLGIIESLQVLGAFDFARQTILSLEPKTEVVKGDIAVGPLVGFKELLLGRHDILRS
ncbi:MAG: hypothetical protein ACYC44_03220 [Patescibacteria group bacterium]